MLKSPRAERFFNGFMSQWMHLNRFDEVGLNSRLLLHRTDGMIHSSKREPIEFFKTLARENLSASNLIDSDFVTINGTLALNYGLTEHYSGHGFQKVSLPKDSPRGGLMTQAAFLSIGAMNNRTSPGDSGFVGEGNPAQRPASTASSKRARVDRSGGRSAGE